MEMKTLPGLLGLLVLAMAPASYAEEADDSLDDIIPEDCILARSIKETDVVDDQTILFHMRGGKIYRNNLDHKCSGLKREESFMYEVKTGRLCDIDIIKVVDDFSRVTSNGIRTQMVGPSCFLGKFYPISEEAAEILLREDDSSPPQPPKDETEAEPEAAD